VKYCGGGFRKPLLGLKGEVNYRARRMTLSP